MRKMLLAAVLMLGISAAAIPQTGFAEEKGKPAASAELAENAKSAILMDADTGTIIYEKNSHDKLPHGIKNLRTASLS